MVIVALIVVAVVAAMTRVAGWRTTATRLGSAALIVVIVTFLSTWALRQFPGDPCIAALGTNADEDSVASCTRERGLDRSVVVQYRRWAGDMVRGDLGYAEYRTQIPFTQVLERRGPRTIWLFVYSQVIALAIAVPAGVWAAYQSGRAARSVPRWALPVGVVAAVAVTALAGWGPFAVAVFAIGVPVAVHRFWRGGPGGDALVNAGAFALLSIPVFVLGEALRYLFAVDHDWYQLTGYDPWSEGMGAHLSSVWLPALVLGLAVCPVYLRLLRADMVQNLQQEYVSVARAKGMPDRHILLRHVLRPSTVTLLTVAGLNIAQLVNGAIVVEYIFDFDGLGSYLIEAVRAREFFPVQTLVALVTVVFVVANTLIDMLYAVIDPRVRAQGRR